QAQAHQHKVLFRRHPLSPVASTASLGLLALELRQLRGALAARALREAPVAAP
ncbi:MAG: hypothetical protein QG571_627, partial [Pseudomonadota bacterium]|nr:hypothetical protein [Pseudomonadota bacterium]